MTYIKNNLIFISLIFGLFSIPSLFYMPSLNYLGLPREILWVFIISICSLSFLIKNKNITLPKDPLFKLLLLFLIWSFMSSFWAWQPQLSWNRLIILLSAFLTYLSIRSFEDHTKTKILWAIAIYGTLLSVLGFLQQLQIEPFNLIRQTDKPGMLMGHRNVAAEYLLMTLGATLALIPKYTLNLKVLLFLFAGSQLSAIAITRCRGILLSISLVLVTFFLISLIRKRTNFKKYALLILIPFILFCVALVTMKLPGVSKEFSIGKMNSIEMRKAHYSNTLVMISENPLRGVGLGNFAIHYTKYLNSWIPDKPYSDKLILKNVHNDYLECLAELGPIGFFIFTSILWTIFFKIKTSSLSSKILKFTLLAQCINALFNFPFQVLQTQFICSVILACIHHKKDYSDQSVPMLLPFSIRVLIFLGILFLGHHQYSRLQSNQHAKKALDYLVEKQHVKALPELRSAVEFQPHQVDIMMLLAYCLREMNYITESSSIAENVLGVFPGYLPALNLIGLNALHINDLNRAIRAFETSYTLQPHQDTTQQKLAYAYQKFSMELRAQNFLQDSIKYEMKLMELFPSRHDSKLRITMDYINLKKLEEAKKIFFSIPKTFENSQKYYVEAHIHIATENFIEAFEIIEKGLNIDPKDKVLQQLKQQLVIINEKKSTIETD